MEALAFARFIIGMALTLDALEGSPRSREGGHALISGDFGPLSELIYNLGNIYGIRHKIKWLGY